MRLHFSSLLCVLTFSALSATGRAVTELPKVLQSGVPTHDLAATAAEDAVFRIEVPAGATRLVVESAGGEGDCDLYVRMNAHPTTEKFTWTSRSSGTRERIVIPYPLQGTWYLLVDAASAYRGVRLRADVTLSSKLAAAPTMAPSPGSFGDRAKVFLQKRRPNGVVRYTLDGSTPTKDSPIYRKPLVLSESTTVTAATFLPGGGVSPIATGSYTVRPSSEAISLASGVPESHLGGMAGSETLLKITVTGGQSTLRVFSGGGSGQSTLFVRRGEPPTTKLYDGKGNGARNSAMVTITDPAEGDWYILLRGVSTFSGAFVTAVVQADMPDLVVWRERLQPYVSEGEVFTDSDCEVVEGMIQPGTRRLLRFSTESRNLGGADLVLGRPEDHPELFEFQECHGHYHFRGFASYRLLKENGDLVTTGNKVSFCLEDVIPWDIWSPDWSRYDCERQGIQVGWSDIYDSGLPGQWVDITGVPPGDYVLEVTLNPEHILPEADYTNNTVQLPVTIPPEPAP